MYFVIEKTTNHTQVVGEYYTLNEAIDSTVYYDNEYCDYYITKIV